MKECDSEIPQMGDKVCHGRAKGAIELSSVFGGSHEVDRNRVHGGTSGHV